MASPLTRTVVALGIALGALSGQANGRSIEPPPPAYQLAAHGAGVPSPVLYAVALQESGTLIRGRLRPWPWTLNIAGTAHRYRTRQTACEALTKALRRVPAKRIDAGLGQINIGHQAHRGIAPCDLLDPHVNLGLAATILREHHTSGENWIHAIGRYHRPAGGAPAARYRRAVLRHLVRLTGSELTLASAWAHP
ncbi:transglycosylase SLT domain-containing protein [Pseudomonas aeruginosa]|uniref:transglycosylase SLT domain-containing protein n=1 Tax=Pseudomonas aeruginosa TaxID=287 RepID=UPI0009415CF5|nr:transglycosylase SLT domain-containing protein [Pseudomonas aeruginosa]MCO3843621.1 lytic transglycosylase domain-containing protein [Pseudomonas aeruginosa]NPW39417.1 transglycosylase SLT domain-containing protein [Pseudomonas aeruginosa]HBP1183187.1 lytic transglycosylase domain-containing protein [Pseudomonas aeruginosa]HCL4171933.1 transglycosylase SLT domain-containing protein [Pseudomonas aeruginosa]HEP8173712.1 transglycosylase SLT domain-containing protein [Pseudomonas aeruginosa]